MFFSKKSASDKGTLYQLKHLIHRTAVRDEPKQCTKAAEDFLLVVFHAYIVAAAKVCRENDEITDSLSCAKKILSSFVNIRLPSAVHSEDCDTDDMAYNYATDLLTLCLIWHGYHDAIKEGDGNRILLYWKFLLPIFQQEGRFNYAKEAFMLIAQTEYLSERKATELKWSRTVNTHGRQGKNIPIDLYMEHLNRQLKYMIGNLQSNVKPTSIQRVAKSLGIVHNICQIFSELAEAPVNKGYVSCPSFQDDSDKILQQLEEEEVFKVKENRTLQSYTSQPLMSHIKWANLQKWLKEKILNLDVY